MHGRNTFPTSISSSSLPVDIWNNVFEFFTPLDLYKFRQEFGLNDFGYFDEYLLQNIEIKYHHNESQFEENENDLEFFLLGNIPCYLNISKRSWWGSLLLNNSENIFSINNKPNIYILEKDLFKIPTRLNIRNVVLPKGLISKTIMDFLQAHKYTIYQLNATGSKFNNIINLPNLLNYLTDELIFSNNHILKSVRKLSIFCELRELNNIKYTVFPNLNQFHVGFGIDVDHHIKDLAIYIGNKNFPKLESLHINEVKTPIEGVTYRQGSGLIANVRISLIINRSELIDLKIGNDIKIIWECKQTNIKSLYEHHIVQHDFQNSNTLKYLQIYNLRFRSSLWEIENCTFLTDLNIILNVNLQNKFDISKLKLLKNASIGFSDRRHVVINGLSKLKNLKNLKLIGAILSNISDNISKMELLENLCFLKCIFPDKKLILNSNNLKSLKIEYSHKLNNIRFNHTPKMEKIIIPDEISQILIEVNNNLPLINTFKFTPGNCELQGDCLQCLEDYDIGEYGFIFKKTSDLEKEID